MSSREHLASALDVTAAMARIEEQRGDAVVEPAEAPEQEWAPPPASPAPAEGEGAPLAVVLEVAMWSGAWGLLDSIVDLLAPDDTRARLLLYLALLTAAQLSPCYRAPRQPDLPDAALRVGGFLTAVALCSGSWGLVDVAVEKLAQCLSLGSGLAPVLTYGALVTATAGLVAMHPRRGAILESLSQVSWT